MKRQSADKLKIKAWNKAIDRWTKEKKRKPTLGQLAGGCPNCGHMCSFDEKTFRCGKCGWYWREELKNKYS